MSFHRVRDHTGEPLLCCWDECGQYSLYEFRFEVQETLTKKVTYTFCNERHRLYWMNSHISNGNLPTGLKTVH